MRISDSTLRRFWKNYRGGGRATKGIDPKVAEHLWDLLSALDAAARPEDMDQPAWDFHALTGDRKGQYAVEIRAQFRLVFEWERDEAVRVRREDYHGR